MWETKFGEPPERTCEEYLVVKTRAGAKRAQAAAEIARVGTSPVSLVGRVLVTALVIVRGDQVPIMGGRSTVGATGSVSHP